MTTTMMMDEELKKLSWFLEGPFFTTVPTPTREIKSGQEIVEYLNENNLTIISFDVVSNLRKELHAKEKEWEKERKEMKKEMNKLQMRKDLCIGNQTNLVKCVRKIAELTDFKESFGSEESKCVLVGQDDLDRFYDHVKSVFKEVSPNSHSPSSSSSSSAECATSTWEVEEKPKVKKARKAVIYSSDDEQHVNSFSKPVKVIKQKIDCLLPSPRTPQPSPFNKLASPCSPSSTLSSSSTKWRCVRCEGRCESMEEYSDHRRTLRRLLPQLRVHGQHISELLPKKKSHQSRVAFLPANPLISSKPLSPRSQFLQECIDDDEDDNGRELIAECLPKSVSCSVCGDTFGDMATLNFHIKKKHNGRGGLMELKQN